ncbi:lipase family alpha/beta hydrolase [Alkanindiges sp. WGS2144]|uniref:lipase family alpha/beta hydrolase n=1 Tax=Alkanindiges sp. WGS2144 TaxID=3366808 RepID=UPI003752CE39
MLKTTLIKGIAAFALISSSSAFAVLQTTPTNTKATYAKTKYPIVLNHGMFGFTRLGTPEFGMDYFYRVMPDLASNGATVYATQVSPLNSTEVRGEQLVAQIEEVLAITGADKVNLIGHSHGGPTTRYAAGVIPNKVASVTTIAGVNKGSKVADFILSTGIGAPVISKFVEATLAPVMDWAQGKPDLPTDMMASLKSLSTAGSLEFNQRFPAGVPISACGNGTAITNGIYNYSWSGNRTVTNLLDPDTIIMGIASLAFGTTPSDGLVGTCSSHFGQVIRDNYAHNHLDEVNMIMGLRGLLSPDPVALFRQHANRLKNNGL